MSRSGLRARAAKTADRGQHHRPPGSSSLACVYHQQCFELRMSPFWPRLILIASDIHRQNEGALRPQTWRPKSPPPRSPSPARSSRPTSIRATTGSSSSAAVEARAAAVLGIRSQVHPSLPSSLSLPPPRVVCDMRSCGADQRLPE